MLSSGLCTSTHKGTYTHRDTYTMCVCMCVCGGISLPSPKSQDYKCEPSCLVQGSMHAR